MGVNSAIGILTFTCGCIFSVPIVVLARVNAIPLCLESPSFLFLLVVLLMGYLAAICYSILLGSNMLHVVGINIVASQVFLIVEVFGYCCLMSIEDWV